MLAACSSAGNWTRDETDHVTMEADLRACDAAARAVHLPDADQQLELLQRVERCMRGRGYTFEPRRRLLL